jgi:DnaA-like protein
MAKLLINEHPLTVLPSLAAKIGLNQAVILQQVHYWLDPRINKNIRDGKHWVYNTYSDWKKQFPFWSEVTIKRIIQSLEKKEFLLSGNFNKNCLDKTKWYTINYNKLQELECSNSPEDSIQSPSDQKDPSKGSKRSIEGINLIPSIYNETETTTETTTSLSFDAHPNVKNKDETPVGESFKKSIILEKKILSKNKSDIKPQPKFLEKAPFQSAEIESQMLLIWNKLIEEGRAPGGRALELTSRRGKGLVSALARSFAGDVAQWSSFCKTVASSKFLMGEITSFKATLDWVLLEANMRKVIQGNYKTGDRDKSNIAHRMVSVNTAEIIKEIAREDTPAEWKEFKSKILMEVGEGAYRSWFSKLEFIEYGDRTLRIKALTGFVKQWVEDKYSGTIKRLLDKSFIGIENYEMQV